MSLEAVLDEERRDVLALLEAQHAPSRTRGSTSSAGSRRNSSPFANPQSPVRSMVDIDDDIVSWHSSLIANAPRGPRTSPRIAPHTAPIRSMLDINSTPPKATHPVRSMLDINTTPPPPPPATATSKSAASSPTEPYHKMAHSSHHMQHRSLSDAATRPAGFGPRAGGNSVSAYQFSGYLPSNPGGPVVPKRNTQAGKKNSFTGAMAEVMRGGDITAFGKDRGRNSIAGTSSSGISGAKSKSPHNRFGVRSNSPSLTPDPSKYVLDDGRVIDMNSAYRRLSDANLALSGGNLSALSGSRLKKKRPGGDPTSPGGSRLEKDYTPIDGEDVAEDSTDEDRHSSEDERPRGRKKNIPPETEKDHDPEAHILGMGRAKGPRTAQSLMAAAEKERKFASTKHIHLC